MPALSATAMARLRMLYLSAKGLHPWRIELFRGTIADRACTACPRGGGGGDLIGGSKNSYIATLVERHSRYVMLVKVANKDTDSVVTALIKSAQKLPRELSKSLTWDRGKELADHPCFTLATDVDVYFCDPQSPLSADCYAIACRALRGNTAQMKIPTGF
jgi:hypothetical protein